MKLTVVIERLDEQRYRALIPHPVGLESEGATPKQAVDRIREMAAQRFKDAGLVEISIPEPQQPHPWAKWAGIWKDHPDFEDFRKNIAEYRKQCDQEETTQ